MAIFQKVRIKDIGRVVTGKTPPTEKLEYFDGIFPFITPSDIPNYKIRSSNRVERTLTDAWRNKAINYLLPRNSICYVCIGSTVGKSCMTNQESFSNQQINSIICNKEKSNSHFLFYYLKTKLKEIKTIADSSGAGKGIINKTAFENLEVLIPNLSIQNHIASFLSTYDDLIENSGKRGKALEEISQLLYTEWFVKFKFPGYEKVKMVDSGTDYGMVPEGWEVKKLEDVADILFGNNFKSNLFNDANIGVRVVRIRDVLSGVTETFTPEITDQKYLIKKGDLLIGMDGIFHMGMWFMGGCFLNQRVVRIRSKKISAFFIFESIKKQLYYLQKIIVGATVGHLSNGNIRNFKILIPNNQILLNIFQEISDMMINLKLKNQNLLKTRDLLIPQLVTGKRELKYD